MIIYPAIDLIDGKCVRLTQGQYDTVTVFSEDHVQTALNFKEAGASFLHMVDLDGAKSGSANNRNVILKVLSETGLFVQTGGGIRDMEAIDYYLTRGISRVILGTSAVQNPELVKEAVKKYGDKIAVGIDARDGKVAINGWEKTSSFTAVEFAKMMVSLGVEHIIYTDISRDGMLKGPNLKAMEEMSKSVDAGVIASGGVASVKDIIDLSKTGVAGVIVGKAIYTGNINLKEAISVASHNRGR